MPDIRAPERAPLDRRQHGLPAGRYFGYRPQFWLDLQDQYDLAVIERERGADNENACAPPTGLIGFAKPAPEFALPWTAPSFY